MTQDRRSDGGSTGGIGKQSRTDSLATQPAPRAAPDAAPGKRTLIESSQAEQAVRSGRATEPARAPNLSERSTVGSSNPTAIIQPRTLHAAQPRVVQRKEAPTDAKVLENQASLKGTDVEIPALEGALLATRQDAVKRGLLSNASFDAGLALSQAMTQLQPAVAVNGAVDKGLQEKAALAAQQLFAALHKETASDASFDIERSMEDGSISERNRYTAEVRTTTSAIFSSVTNELGSWLQQLPAQIRQAKWDAAFRSYRQMIFGLDLWVADQLRKKGKGTPEEALGNAQDYYAQLRTGLEQIADKHATRLPALFHPDPKTTEKEKAAGRPAAETIPLNVYFWKDAKDGKIHIYDVTTPARPHEQAIDSLPTAASMSTFFEEVARYPEGEVRCTLPGGGAAIAPTTGKTKWYEWVGYAGLAIAAVGLAFLTAGASIPATVCLAGGALAGGLSAGGHLAETAHLGTATTASVVLDVAQIAASFASAGAMNITVKAGGAAAALAGSRWFVPLVGSAAAADVVQLVALTDITFTELSKIEDGPGTPEDKKRAMAVLLTQLLVVSGLTAMSVQGLRSTRALAGKPLEIVEHNGTPVLHVVGDETPAVGAAHAPVGEAPKPPGEVGAKLPEHDGHKPASPGAPDSKSAPRGSVGGPDAGDPDHWLAELESRLTADEKAKLAKMKGGKTPQQVRAMLGGGDLDTAHTRVRNEIRLEQERAAVAAESKARLADLRQQITDRGLMDDPEIRSLIDGTTPKNRDARVAMLRDKLMSKVLRAETERANPGIEVIDGVKLFEKQTEAGIAEWRTKNPGKEPGGLTERDDGLYLERGEIDMLLIERRPGGKARIVSREEIKTGTLDSNGKARGQLDDQGTLLRDGAAGKKVIRLERARRDITGDIDLGSDASASKVTHGPAGKPAFDKSLGISATDLEALCKDLLANHVSPKQGAQ